MGVIFKAFKFARLPQKKSRYLCLCSQLALLVLFLTNIFLPLNFVKNEVMTK